jgi:arginine/serine-rich splicing factor 2
MSDRRDDRGGGDRGRDGRGEFRRPPRDMNAMHSLRVGNLPFNAVAEDLLPLFEKYGDVGDIYFPLERGTGRSRGFAFVRFHDKRDAEDAADALNGRTYDGRDLKISIDPGRPNNPRQRRSRSRSGGRDRRRRSPSRSRSRDRRRRSPSRSRSRDRKRRSDSGDDRRRSSGGRARSASRSRSRS